LKIGLRYLLTYQLADAEPVSVLGIYRGLRPMLTRDGQGHAFDTGKSLLILTETAIVSAVSSLEEVSDVA
jgi:hypothetical protein